MQTAPHGGETADPERLDERGLRVATIRGRAEAGAQIRELGPVRSHPARIRTGRSGRGSSIGSHSLAHGQPQRLTPSGRTKNAAARGFERALLRQREPDIGLWQKEFRTVRNPELGRFPEEQAIEEIGPAIPTRDPCCGAFRIGIRRQHQGDRLLDQTARRHGPESAARERRRSGPEQLDERRLARQSGERPPGNEDRPVSEEKSLRLRIVEDEKAPTLLESRLLPVSGGEERALPYGLETDLRNTGSEFRIPDEWPATLERAAGTLGGVNCRRVRRHGDGRRRCRATRGGEAGEKREERTEATKRCRGAGHEFRAAAVTGGPVRGSNSC